MLITSPEKRSNYNQANWRRISFAAMAGETIFSKNHSENLSSAETYFFSTKRLFKNGKSYREIAKIVGRSHSCVQKIIGRFKSDGLIENKSGRGRKSILSDVDKRKVLKDIKIDRKLSAVKLAAETSRIIGDESKFNIFGSDGRRTVWRKPNTALDPKNLRPTQLNMVVAPSWFGVVWLQMG
ncbi:HTH_Tnp_Tc3_2 domain-containing protein [Trichonephila clavipes]|nr:HTH_Tnp_Tc3_2 domain-containing protein [Trichonephila clavipes]